MASVIDNSALRHITEPLNEARIIPTVHQCTIEYSEHDASALINETATPAQFIYAEMLKNAAGPHARGIFNLLQPNSPFRWFDPLYPSNVKVAFERFIDLVNDDNPWDYKKLINRLPKQSHKFGGKELNTDVWGNVHYGFVGRASGFTRYILLTGAGFHQLFLSKKGADPMDEILYRAYQANVLNFLLVADYVRDINAIKLGMRLYEEFGITLKFQSFEEAVAADPSEL